MRLLDEEPSRTAQGAALFRAIESLEPEDKRLCFDPLAKEFLDSPFKAMAGSRKASRAMFNMLVEQGMGPLYGEVVVRTMYIDALLRDRIADGIEQLVIMGAGYDTRAYRCEGLEAVRVFELDHSVTQRNKKERMTRALGVLPGNVIYVPIDFNSESLSEKLSAAGYDTRSKSFFIWEGVTMYLDSEAVDDTLAFVAGNAASGSSIVFNYAYAEVGDIAGGDEGAKKWRAFLESLGEPHRFGIEEGKIEEFMSARGFIVLESVSCAELGATCFADRGRTQEVTRFAGLVHAAVR
jgi:methyltransferase (TIGR00027 family)